MRHWHKVARVGLCQSASWSQNLKKYQRLTVRPSNDGLYIGGARGSLVSPRCAPHTVINIQTDVTVTPSMLSKCNWQTLCRIAKEGTEEQQDCLIAWGYSGIPAWQFEDLYFMAKGEEWSQA